MSIVAAALKGLESLEEEFRNEPTLFFTEHDLASRAYELIQKELDHRKVRRNGGKSYYLVHHEYPTPFRCDMSGRSFAVKEEDDRTPRGGKYQRGHYDLVVFSPEFLQQCDYQLAKGQDYEIVKRDLPSVIKTIGSAPILVGIEFMFNRDPFASEKNVEDWWKGVLQDYQKLDASRQWKKLPFMEQIVMMFFDVAACDVANEDVADLIRRGEIRHCVPVPQR